MEQSLRVAAHDGLEALRQIVGAKNLTCHIYNPHSELYWLFERTGGFDYEYQLSGPLTHPDQSKRFTEPGNPSFPYEGIQIDFFPDPLPLALHENVLAAESFSRRERIRHPIRVRLFSHVADDRAQAYIFVNFAAERLPREREELAKIIHEQVSVLRPFLLEMAKRPRLEGRTAWLLRSTNLRLRNRLRKIWLGSPGDLQNAKAELFNEIADSVMNVLVKPLHGGRNLLCTVSTVDADNKIAKVGSFPTDPHIPEQPGIVHHVAHAGQFFYLPNTEDYQRRVKEQEERGTGRSRSLPAYVECDPRTRCELAVPLIIQSRVVGVINLEADHADAYNDEHVLMLFQFASTVALLVQLITLFKDLHIANRLQQALLDSAKTTEADVFLKVLSACKELGYELPAIWDQNTKDWVFLPKDPKPALPRPLGCTNWVVKNRQPLALADIHLDRELKPVLEKDKTYAGELDEDSGYFRGWSPKDVHVDGLNPDLARLIGSPEGVLTDLAFPIFSGKDGEAASVRAVLWAKCKRHFCALLDDECWCLSVLCRSATVALPVARERLERDQLLLERYGRAERARALMFNYHFGAQRAEEIRRLVQANPKILEAKAARDVIVLNVDIRGSTQTTAAIMRSGRPAEYAAFMLAFQKMVQESVLEYKGVFDKTMGDGAQALFNVYRPEVLGPGLSGAPDLNEIEMAGSILCTLEIFRRFRELVDKYRRRLGIILPNDFALGAGLSVGKAFVGGFLNPEDLPGFEYSAHGEPANHAAKLQQTARAKELLIILKECYARNPNCVWPLPETGATLQQAEFGVLAQKLNSNEQGVLLVHPKFQRFLPPPSACHYMIPFGDRTDLNAAILIIP